jgi:alpha-beta hydrolase superfamily lysophospholipase
MGLRFNALRREALALARQATLLRHDLAAVVPVDATETVVLVHGFLATAGVLRPLGAALEAEAGVATASFTHPPGLGVVELAERVKEVVRRLTSERVHLVGHSIGGLAARWFVQELGGDARVVQTLSLASPFWGVRRSGLVPGALARDLAPESALLAKLRAGIARGVPHFAVSGTHDLVVGPAGSLGAAGEILADGCGHNAVLYDRQVLAHVVGRVRQARRPGEAQAGRGSH